MTDSRERPISIAILAVGGQGGGVLTKWLVDTAEANGYIAQSTFVAGVAQRTGATVYCVEMFSRDRAQALGQEPVFTPYPVPGDVDLVVVGEMAETGRAIQKGFVTPNITTLISSSHRIYSIVEKEALGDGIMDQAPIADAAAKAAREFICFDMQQIADETGCVVSAVLLGAIAAAGTLPFTRDAYEATIRSAGRTIDSSLRGFAAGHAAAGKKTEPAETVIPPAVTRGTNGEALAARINAQLPQQVDSIALHGALRALDYQDSDYAATYLDRVTALHAIVTANGGESREFTLVAEATRQLALQMCYEDTIRVADLKTRRERSDRIRHHVAATPEQPAHVVEYFHPRFEEVCDTLPASIGAYCLQSTAVQKLLSPLFRKGRNIKTTSISGFLLLYMLAKLRRFRRGTYRFKVQDELIRDWLVRIQAAAVENPDYALAIARCIEMVRGYGKTYERGLTRYRKTVESTQRLPATERAAAVVRLHKAALADEKGQLFGDVLAALEIAP